ncbi:MAG: hypothetical protein Q8O12_06685 [Candidatus Omnitrophota bacterium]|nr:hypothetical protein [Candidatus Omnitrophota bacterium]
MGRFSALFLIAILILLLQTGTACRENSKIIQPSQESDYAIGEILVKFKPEAFNDKGEIVSGSISALNFKYGLAGMERVFKDSLPPEDMSYIYKLKFQGTLDIDQAIEDYKKDPSVMYAEPNYIAHTMEKGQDADKENHTFR